MSRPAIQDNAKRLIQVNIRLTTEESNKLNENAASSGLTPANWIRHKIFTGKNPPARLSPLDTSIYMELKRIGVNLNQAAHKLNLGEFPKDLYTIQLELQSLLSNILKAMLHDRQHDQG
ncbi:MAG: plasmid mobilization relaxosome protein MobC [Cyclobacteriaceae bacterium]|nr:plasmid mobilization relaxosome protein MobC [Cyclobacteriaceae bacterium]